MGYLIASYAIVVVSIGAYLTMLRQRRGMLRKALSQDRKSNRG